MALKKSQLYSSIWESCDALRGGMDASQYKDYILTLLFMKYVTDKYADDPNSIIEVPSGGSFNDMLEHRGSVEIGEKINIIISAFAKENDLVGVIDVADFNDESKLGSGKDMQERLSKLLNIFNDIDFRSNRAEGDDLLGDAYEYLMRNFATQSGKSKGQFYTPAEVSRIIAKVVGIGEETRKDDTIYDPTCGSGSLLIKAADETPNSITIYGQEKDNATWALCRMNMMLHGHITADIRHENTLTNPKFLNDRNGLRTFDFAVANPPFSDKNWTTGLNPDSDEYERFEYGTPPPKNGDFAYLLHLLKSLKSKGKGAIILPHGVLFRGNKEADIRRNLIKRGFIKGIIGMPANLFYGTGIPACIVVIDKENAHARSGIFMIDASKGYMKDGNKNRLRSQDIHKIVDTFNRQIEVPRYSRMVPIAEIASPENDYNLNIPRYIDSSEPEDLHDLDAHLNGGIPERDIDALEPYWKVFPSLREELFESNGRPGYCEPKVETNKISSTILEHAEYKEYLSRVSEILDQWKAEHESLLKGIDIGSKPKEIIHILSEDLLERFREFPLLDRYDVYQQLMDYWAEVMQDDVYLVAAVGWQEAVRPRPIIEDKDKKIKETPDLTIGKKKYKMDLIPPSLIAGHFFADQLEELENLQAQHQFDLAELEEYIEENTGEEGLLDEVTNDKGNITKASLNNRLKELTLAMDMEEEYDAVSKCLELFEAESERKKAAKDAQDEFDKLVFDQYSCLEENEIKAIVVRGKWYASIQSAIESEVNRLIQNLSTRLRELENRYDKTLSVILDGVVNYKNKVDKHLKNMRYHLL